MNPKKACVFVNWAIIRYLQQQKLKKKILKMAMMKAGFETKVDFRSNPCEPTVLLFGFNLKGLTSNHDERGEKMKQKQRKQAILLILFSSSRNDFRSSQMSWMIKKQR